MFRGFSRVGACAVYAQARELDSLFAPSMLTEQAAMLPLPLRKDNRDAVPPTR